jgi:hypothetical protein
MLTPVQYPDEWVQAHRQHAAPGRQDKFQVVDVQPPVGSDTLLGAKVQPINALVDESHGHRVFRYCIELSAEDQARLMRTGRFELGVIAEQMPPIIIDSMQE